MNQRYRRHLGAHIKVHPRGVVSMRTTGPTWVITAGRRPRMVPAFRITTKVLSTRAAP